MDLFQVTTCVDTSHTSLQSAPGRNTEGSAILQGLQAAFSLAESTSQTHACLQIELTDRIAALQSLNQCAAAGNLAPCYLVEPLLQDRNAVPQAHRTAIQSTIRQLLNDNQRPVAALIISSLPGSNTWELEQLFNAHIKAKDWEAAARLIPQFDTGNYKSYIVDLGVALAKDSQIDEALILAEQLSRYRQATIYAHIPSHLEQALALAKDLTNGCERDAIIRHVTHTYLGCGNLQAAWAAAKTTHYQNDDYRKLLTAIATFCVSQPQIDAATLTIFNEVLSTLLASLQQEGRDYETNKRLLPVFTAALHAGHLALAHERLLVHIPTKYTDEPRRNLAVAYCNQGEYTQACTLIDTEHHTDFLKHLTRQQLWGAAFQFILRQQKIDCTQLGEAITAYTANGLRSILLCYTYSHSNDPEHKLRPAVLQLLRTGKAEDIAQALADPSNYDLVIDAVEKIENAKKTNLSDPSLNLTDRMSKILSHMIQNCMSKREYTWAVELLGAIPDPGIRDSTCDAIQDPKYREAYNKAKSAAKKYLSS